MKLPLLFAIDDDPQVLNALQADLRRRYRKDYRILATTSAAEGLDALAQLRKQGEDIALLMSDQRMPEMQGVDFLQRAKGIFPDAKRVLLTAYSDTEAAIRAINDVGLDYYLLKPWNPPEERMYPVLDELLFDWRATWTPAFEGVKLVGYQWSPQSHALKDFLSGNLIPYQWFDMQRDAERAQELLATHNLPDGPFPVVVYEDGTAETAPGVQQVAQRLGKQVQASQSVYDVAIIGGGPAGLAAAVYGSSEGLRTVLIEKRAPGGQAGTSSRIENYLGFPTGVSGADLANRALTQAKRFGAEVLSPAEVADIQLQDGYKKIVLADGTNFAAKAVILAMGVDYRKLDADGIDNLTGKGVYYGAANTEAAACRNQDVYIVGGGNSAGQAALYLSQYARAVHIVIRAKDLTASMSHYLIENIGRTANIQIVPCTQIKAVHGNEQLEALTLESVADGSTQQVPASSLFVFIGAKPVTDWLQLRLIRNDKGFLETGTGLKAHPDYKQFWKLDRDPMLLETCVAGVFAAGDVRAGAMNRVASGVGEGSMAIKFVHEYLAS